MINWSYYYQKGDLARQEEDWDGVVRLWKESESQEHRPRNGIEFMPCIEGYAHTENWEKAAQLTLRSNELTDQMRPMLCACWDKITSATPFSEEKETAIQAVNDVLDCSD